MNIIQRISLMGAVCGENSGESKPLRCLGAEEAFARLCASDALIGAQPERVCHWQRGGGSFA